MDFGRRMGCHQMPERSLFIRGYQLPVCARCTGVILGELIAIILLLCGVGLPIYVSAALLIPMGVDWGLQFCGILPSDNIRRLASGLLGGAGLTYIYWAAICLVIGGLARLFA